MNFRDYIVGRNLVRRSPLPRVQIVEAINAAAGSMLNPLYDGVSGRVYFGRLRLALSIAFYSNSFRPILTGKLVDTQQGTELRASFGAPLWLLVFWVFWYFALFLFLILALVIHLRNPIEFSGLVMVLFIMTALITAPFFFHRIANSSAEQHLDLILEFLEQVADLR